MAVTVEELAVKVQKVDDRSLANEHRLEKVEKDLADNQAMVASIARLSQKQEDMDSDIKEIKTDVKSLTAKPGKRWDNIVDKVIWAFLAAMIAFVLAYLGLK